MRTDEKVSDVLSEPEPDRVESHLIEVSRRVSTLPDARKRFRIQVSVARTEVNDRLRIVQEDRVFNGF